jgi:hypothetical protein
MEVLFLACIFNVFSFLLLVWVSIKELKGRNSMLLYYCLICIYIVQIPLIYDSFSFLIRGSDVTKMILFNHNNTVTSSADYYILNTGIIFKASIYVFLSNIVLIGCYNLCVKKKITFYKKIEPSNFMSNVFYLLIGLTAISIFIYYYGFDISRIGVDYRNTTFGGTNPLLSFILNLCMISLISVVLKGFVCRTYFTSFILLIPMLIIGTLTVARALIISIPLIILYYIVNVNHRKNIVNLIGKIFMIGAIFIFILLFIRGHDASFYPISRDISVFDLYYGIANKMNLNTSDGYYFFNVIKIGVPFWEWPQNYETLESMLGSYRYFSGWGTLHPTFFGWTYIDAGWYGLLTAAFFGFFIGLTDIVRYHLSMKLSLLFLPFQLSFVAVMVRGSIQYAYGNIIYILIFFMICLFVMKFIFNKKLMKNNSYICNNHRQFMHSTN